MNVFASRRSSVNILEIFYLPKTTVAIDEGNRYEQRMTNNIGSTFSGQKFADMPNY